MHRSTARKEILPDKGGFANCKNTAQEERGITRSEIRKIIESHGKWYQNIRFSFMLETRHARRGLGSKILAESRLVAKKWLSTDTKLNLYLSHGKASIGAECIVLGTRACENNCVQVHICLL